MFVSTLVTVLALQATPAQLQRIAWVPNPRRTTGTWVSDPAHHLADSTVAALNREIGGLEQATGAEIAVVVVDSTSGLTPFDFALALHRGWGVGKAGRDNGVVLLWVPSERAIQISVGYGLEGAIPDRRAGRIRDEAIIPAFRRNAFDEGMLAGVRALAAAARAETGGREGIARRMERAEGGAARPGAAASEGSPAFGIFLTAVFVAAVAGVIAFLTRRWRRNRRRKCPKCGTKMDRLDEKADDALLDKGERLEEQLRSVDYDVWKCGKCGETLKLAYEAKWTGTATCPQCKRKTLKVTETTVRAASTTHDGLKTIHSKCVNCGHAFQAQKSIPVVVSSSSSDSSSSSSDSGSSGGGSDFGGGSAGGGGAGGTY